MDKALLQTLCYSVAQLEKARIANLMQSGFGLSDDDKSIAAALGGVSTVGQHAAGLELGVNRLAKITPEGVPTDGINQVADELARAARAEVGEGYHIERMRYKGLRYLRSLMQKDAETVLALIAQMAALGIKIDLDAVINEGAKP